jgi:hypothetical protein
VFRKILEDMMNNNLKILLAVVVAAIVVVMVVDRDDDIGDKLEEAANDAGRDLEDATEELKDQ